MLIITVLHMRTTSCQWIWRGRERRGGHGFADARWWSYTCTCMYNSSCVSLTWLIVWTLQCLRWSLWGGSYHPHQWKWEHSQQRACWCWNDTTCRKRISMNLSNESWHIYSSYMSMHDIDWGAQGAWSSVPLSISCHWFVGSHHWDHPPPFS